MKILFVCLGNICRSPIAEGIMKELAEKYNLNWKIDSAGTEYYHVGEMPDHRAIKVCNKFGIDISNQRARRITQRDFDDYDIVYALAEDVFDDLIDFAGDHPSKTKLKLFLEDAGETLRSVPDPWYGSEKDFEPVFYLIRNACDAIVAKYAQRPSEV